MTTKLPCPYKHFGWITWIKNSVPLQSSPEALIYLYFHIQGARKYCTQCYHCHCQYDTGRFQSQHLSAVLLQAYSHRFVQLRILWQSHYLLSRCNRKVRHQNCLYNNQDWQVGQATLWPLFWYDLCQVPGHLKGKIIIFIRSQDIVKTCQTHEWCKINKTNEPRDHWTPNSNKC